MVGGEGEPTSRVNLRDFLKLQRMIKSLGSDIQNIRNKGFLAITSLTDRNVFRGMHSTLDKLYEQFLSKWEECVDYSLDHDSTFPSTEDTAYLDSVKAHYYDALGYGIQLFNPPASRPNDLSVPNITQSSVSMSRAILPKIHIKPFKGDIPSWPTFKQMFESLIIGDECLSDAERFHYLISFLDGPALDCIKHTPVLEANFTQAWNGLCTIYDNQRKIACHYLDKLLSFKPNSGKATSDSLQTYLSSVTETVVSLQNLNIPQFAEYLLCELALRGLDQRTREAFELSIVNVTFPTFETLKKFVQGRFQALRMTDEVYNSHPKSSNTSTHQSSVKHKSPNQFTPPKQVLFTTDVDHANTHTPVTGQVSKQLSSLPLSCYICKGTHTISDCIRFKKGTPQQRLELLKGFSGCRNCLHLFHKTKECTSKYNCRTCKGRHHSDLHLSPVSKPVERSSSNQPSFTSQSTTDSSFVGASTSPSKQEGVLLGTVCACILDSKGQPQQFRGLLDPGSQFSFITNDCAKKLGKSTRPYHGTISGVNSSHLRNISGKVNIAFLPRSSMSLLETEAIFIPTITPPLPQVPLSSDIWQDYLSYPLSDPQFTQSLPISFLIGADLFSEVLTGTPIKIHDHGPSIIDTVFGFVVMGKFSSNDVSASAFSLLSTSSTVDLIERFWKVEEPCIETAVDPEDEACEKHFLDHHYRTTTGRYVVSLPFKSPQPSIVPNINKAINRFHALESKFLKNPQLHQEYSAFMQEYLDLGHMSPATSDPSYVIPHHPVYKDDNEGGQKLRVVFDASFRTSSGSLNEHLLTGPKLQADIGNVILNFRRFKYVVSCDVVKMFRQILVNPDDRKYQQIVWRFRPTDPLQFYELNTVTYGLTSSPFQSQRVLHQLAIDEGHRYPACAAILRENTYIDDVAFGADSVEDILALKADLVNLLSLGGFNLSKWKTNHPPLLETEPISQRPVPLCIEEGVVTKILGMSWDPTTDAFCYQVSQPQDGFTKRIILSIIARLFDPLGYLAPVVFYAKKILQETWKVGIGWDDTVPEYLKTQWTQFVSDFHYLAHISIPRALPLSSATYQLLCFCDATNDGYCAAVYLRSSQSSNVFLSLLKAKTRLSPLKPLTIPRLELCGAALLAQLIKSLEPVRKHYAISETFCFSDSTVVLSWLKTPPHKLQTFVSNRVQQVLDVTKPEWWSHIKGVDNPADVGSRGVLPSALVDHRLWWYGPAWCYQPVSTWPRSSDFTPVQEVPEMKPQMIHMTLTAVNHHQEFIKFFRAFFIFQ